jgi:hypothetical protein
MTPPKSGDEVHEIVLKNERKREKGQCYYPFTTLVFKVAPCSSYRESPELSLSYTSGNFSS